jgi:hypothetical protein
MKKSCLLLLILFGSTIWGLGLGARDSGLGAQGTAVPDRPAAPRPEQLPLVQSDSLVYKGSFAFSHATVNGTRFGYGGTGLAFDRDRGTMFLVGHDWHQKAAEIAIPDLRDVRTQPLENASLVQPFYDPTDGKFIAIAGLDMAKVGGILPWEGRLIVSVFHYYDAGGTQKASHFVSGRDLSIPGDAIGPVKVGNLLTGFTSGYMTVIPEAWRTALGGPALTGNCCIPIVSRTSYGPALFTFEPNDVGVKNPVPAKPLVYYPQDRPLAAWEATSPLFNGTSNIGGVVFPEGTRSVLFFGRHGTGKFCYGSTCFPGAGQGTHAPPYITQVWAYDANDLAAVKTGSKKPWDVRPYATWEMVFPGPNHAKYVKGATYDPKTGRIFLVQEGEEAPLVHVYNVQLR